MKVVQTMRIALVGPVYPFRGGIAHYTTLLCRHLRQRHETQLLTFRRQYPRWLFKRSDRDPSLEANKQAGEAILDPLNPLTWYATAVKVREKKPDLLIIVWWVAYWALPFRFLTTILKRQISLPVLFICHNILEHESNFLKERLTRWGLGDGDIYIVHSEEDLQRLKRMRPQAKIVKSLMPCFDIFPSGERRRAVKEGQHLLFFGFVREYKGLEYLLRSMPLILREREVTLWIVGEFWEDKEKYLRLIEELGIADHVVIDDRYIPNEEVAHYFEQADLVLLPYIASTQSAVIQTAYAFNKPVLVTDVGGLKEAVRDGETGYVVKARSPDAIAEAVRDFFEGERAATMQENIRAFKEAHSWDHLIDLIEGLYAGVEDRSAPLLGLME